MPALPFLTRGLRLVFNGTFLDAVWANVMHAQGTAGPPTQPDLDSLASSISSAWATNLAPLVVSEVALTTMSVFDISSDIGLVGISQITHNGTHAGIQPLPAQVAIGVTWKIGRHYRGGHPRNFLPGVDETELASGSRRLINTTYQTTVKNGWAGFLAAVNAMNYPSIGTVTLGQASYYHGKGADGKPVLRPTPIFDKFTAAAVDLRLDTIRRRLGKDLPA